MMNYILDGKNPIECEDILQWGKWFATADRHVNQTKRNGINVSTIFLGIDHSFDGGGPILFETMIFGGEQDQEQWRYATWEEAEEGHKKACELAGI